MSFQTLPVYFTHRTAPGMEFDSNSTEVRELLGRQKEGRKVKKLPVVPFTLWSALSGPASKSLCLVLETQSQRAGNNALLNL